MIKMDFVIILAQNKVKKETHVYELWLESSTNHRIPYLIVFVEMTL